MNSNKEKGKENKLLIYTIYFGEESIWEWFHSCYNHLKLIAKLGNTGDVYKETTFIGLDTTLQKISNSINPNIGLKYNS